MEIKEKNYSEEKLVVFDMIGTLTTEPHLISQVFLSAIPGLERDVVKKYYEEYKVDNISRETFWENVGIKEFEELERKFLDSIFLRERITTLLKEMKKHYRLAILSNIPKEWGHFLSEKFNFKEFFDEIVFSGDYKVKKPDHQIYKILVDKFPEISPSNVFFVDDDLEKLKSAKDYLMKTIWLQSNEISTDFVPDFVIQDITEVKDIVK